MRSPKFNTNIPFLLFALIVLVGGTWAGLIRLGWRLPLNQPTLVVNHGPLMVAGFFGTLIALERAVAMRTLWAFAAPLACGIGGIIVLFGNPGYSGPLLLTIGSAVLVIVNAYLLYKHWAGYMLIMTVGAVALLVGNLLWLLGWQVYQFVLWWAGFLVLTIAGERLELGRMTKPSQFSKLLFYIAISIYLAGLVVLLFNWQVGIQVTSIGTILLALWLLRYDIARRTVKLRGLTRFIAICLLSGYAWLIVSGLIGLIYGGIPAGPLYDALLHSIFIGFVFSMIFGHAPIIFPAILKYEIEYRPVFYLPLILLHKSLALRIAGDLYGITWLRLWGGLFNVFVVIGYLILISPLSNVIKKSKNISGTSHQT